MPDAEWFVFQARLDRVVDGDTIDLIVDLGFRARHETRVRLLGVDTAEVYGVSKESDEYARGIEHTGFVMEWFNEHDDGSEWPFILDTQEDTGKYGRWPGSIVAKDDGSSLVQDLVAEYPEVANDGSD